MTDQKPTLLCIQVFAHWYPIRSLTQNTRTGISDVTFYMVLEKPCRVTVKKEMGIIEWRDDWTLAEVPTT